MQTDRPPAGSGTLGKEVKEEIKEEEEEAVMDDGYGGAEEKEMPLSDVGLDSTLEKLAASMRLEMEQELPDDEGMPAPAAFEVFSFRVSRRGNSK